ncbi:MAG: hypothetical protein JOZ62_14520 [Acidobacteriaceae bacterium]|nr:hypothetical protein [Acidobacteriaceae bacterium]
MLDRSFVSAVLEGFEGTLDELACRVVSSKLRADLDVIHSQVAAIRASLELPEHGS